MFIFHYLCPHLFNFVVQTLGNITEARFIGVCPGTGDYGHITVEHAPMLMHCFQSMTRYSNQVFEAAHKLQRQLYSRATNHDCLGLASSCKWNG